MKQAVVSVLMGAALAFPVVSYAAGEMSAMDMSGGETQNADANNAMSHGEIKKVDAANGRLTIKHGPLENLGMGAMTMVFKVKDPAMITQVQVGDRIDFVADEVGGALTVVKLQKR